ncbi:mannose-1-phosphate guanylyltransferase/mannose-6-phosphate isomerase [Acidocella sp. KAb 2-4]|uniref:mannose-1-phosphate guanylyltransferase/mannose-6-phosphate isomerase n=1 Tax=Acidocella sp. KAb 2-4 TaxID=2885158 RepID=UPI001D092722|nr:mannose-1-phosphate guanylyltransferase/mannose-6-phosphate isomerase [Acidocella sp. KAb 2-4]MCB5943568.1 mannose-1-phosphate guanylyltransferase/mannose-6-phosphate isomerase [Acidocella sp. KAb 2-4]
MTSAAPANQIIPVILSGGSGTRLWPVSRKSFPKQFWPLIAAHSMLAETALRAASPEFTPPIVVANQDHRFVVAEQLREAGIGGARIVLEPVGRNSAPAIAVAALLAAEAAPDSVLWIMAADAAINDREALRAALRTALPAAQAGHIVTFGMEPTAPETGYGYIARGAALPGLDGVFQVARFVEKPDLARATALLASGGHLWNSGMFLFRADTMLAELEQLSPEVLAAARAALAARNADLDFIRLGTAEFGEAPDISIDYAVAEKTARAVVVPAAIGWSDVGSWAALFDISAKDEAGNVALGDVVLEGVESSYVRSEAGLTALLGVRDLVVVNTQDAVLVASRDQAQNVKLIVDRLKAAKRSEADSHNRTYRPWGFYESLIQGDRFQVKRIVVWPGQKLSLQKHYHRAEHWVVVQGVASVTRDDEIQLLRENESVYLPLGSLHRLENPGKIPLTVIEVQSGAYLGEDDIVRFEDTYGRQ